MSQRKRKKNRLLPVAAAMIGITVVSSAVAMTVYDSFFPRYERQKYALGAYDYSMHEDTLFREEISFSSEGVRLSGYYYPVEDARALVVVVHGYRSGADDFLPLIERITDSGYAVFSYDMTATYSSDGDSGIGMCRALVDLDYALDFLEGEERFSDMPLLLVGHSLGGYAVASALELHPNVRGCVCLAPMNDASTVMIEMSEEYVGTLLAYSTKPIFDFYQSVLFGDYVMYNGVRGINSTDVPVLIVQGITDEVITADRFSIYAKRDEITNPNVEYLLTDGYTGSHTGVWHSEAAMKYAEEVDTELRLLRDKNGGELTDSQMKEFYDSVDHRLYSEVGEEVFSKMLALFEKALEN